MRDLLLHQGHLAPRAEALLFAADRAHHVATVIRPALARGAVVVTDRYVDSSVAYQGAGRDLGADEVRQLSGWATAELVPDLTVVLDLSAEDARRRRGEGPESPDRVESEPDDFHDRVREGFLELARAEPRRYLVVNAASLPEHLQDQVRARLAPMLPETAKQRAEREQREAELAAQAAAEAAAEAERVAEAERAAQAEAERLAREQTEREALLRAQLAADLERAAREERERHEQVLREQAAQAAARDEAVPGWSANASPGSPATAPAAPTQQMPVVLPRPAGRPGSSGDSSAPPVTPPVAAQRPIDATQPIAVPTPRRPPSRPRTGPVEPARPDPSGEAEPDRVGPGAGRGDLLAGADDETSHRR